MTYPFDFDNFLEGNGNLEAFPIVLTCDGESIMDMAGNVEAATSVLYGYIGEVEVLDDPRTIYVPNGEEWDDVAGALEWQAEINADCWDIPTDIVVRYDLEGE